MKKITLLLFLIANTIFSQNISGPKPILTYYNTQSNAWETLGSNIEVDCGNTNFQIKAAWTDIGSPDTYRLESIPYNPKPFANDENSDGVIDASDFVTHPGSLLNTLPDDTWSEELQLISDNTPFNFCFFGNQRNFFRFSFNGIISFNTVGNYPTAPSYALYDTGDYVDWAIQNMGKITPNANMPFRESILTPFHDIDSSNLYALADTYSYWDILGTPKERYFIMGFHHIPMYSCGNANGFATHQMVFYETTNIIEFHIQDKPICDTWAGGYAALGIQNKDLNIGFAPPQRDNLDNWQVLDLTDGFYDGNTNPSYPIQASESWRLIPDGPNGVAPTFSWFTNYNHATNTGTFVSNNPNLTISANDIPDTGTTYTAQVTYVDYCSGETYYATEDINVTVQTIPAPTGVTVQYIGEFSTLDDVIISNTAGYQNIFWYDNASCYGNPLPPTIALADGDTYYAYQSIGSENCCPDSLAVTIFFSHLSVEDSKISNFSLQPNPVKDVLNLVFKTKNSKVTTTIYNIYGRMVYKSDFYQNKEINIPVSNLNSGVYFIRTQVNNKTSTKKFIKI